MHFVYFSFQRNLSFLNKQSGQKAKQINDVSVIFMPTRRQEILPKRVYLITINYPKALTLVIKISDMTCSESLLSKNSCGFTCR